MVSVRYLYVWVLLSLGLDANATTTTPPAVRAGHERAPRANYPNPARRIFARDSDPSDIEELDQDSAGESPWSSFGVVSVNRREWRCTGVLVGHTVVLTAASCLANSDPGKPLEFFAGARGREASGARGARAREAWTSNVRRLGRCAQPNGWAFILLDKPIGREVPFLNLVDDMDELEDGGSFQWLGYREEKGGDGLQNMVPYTQTGVSVSRGQESGCPDGGPLVSDAGFSDEYEGAALVRETPGGGGGGGGGWVVAGVLTEAGRGTTRPFSGGAEMIERYKKIMKKRDGD